MGNFIKCHLLVVNLCQAAQGLEILHQVYDDSEFWDHRDIPTLANCVGEWNQVVATAVDVLRRPGKVSCSLQAPELGLRSYLRC